MERNVVDNIDVNFLFKKGADLTSGLIDERRISGIMSKVKQMATKSKFINYKEVAEYAAKDIEGENADWEQCL